MRFSMEDKIERLWVLQTDETFHLARHKKVADLETRVFHFKRQLKLSPIG